MLFRSHAKFAIIIGEEEMTKNQLSVKNLKTQEQTVVKTDDMLMVFKSLLEDYMQDLEKKSLQENK